MTSPEEQHDQGDLFGQDANHASNDFSNDTLESASTAENTSATASDSENQWSDPKDISEAPVGPSADELFKEEVAKEHARLAEEGGVNFGVPAPPAFNYTIDIDGTLYQAETADDVIEALRAHLFTNTPGFTTITVRATR